MPDALTSVEVEDDLIAALLAEAARAHPRECCGLLLGEGARITAHRPAANVAADPLTRFEIEPVALIAAHREARAGGPRVVGYYHSHPVGPAEPSATDREQSTADLRIWAIIGRGQVAFWHDTVNGFVKLDRR